MAGMKQCLLSATHLMILVLTDSCNQRCIYCQAGKAHYSKMSIDVCRKAVDLAVHSPVSHMTIEFQEGEPTLNPEALRFTVSYARKVFAAHGKHVDFAIASNMTNLDPELLRWMIEQDIHISTSLDGDRNIHEYNRPLAVNKSSYDAWHSGIDLYKKLCKESGKLSVISAIQTTTKKSLHFPEAIVDEYIANGMQHIYVRPLTPLGCARENWEAVGYSPEEYVQFYCRLFDYIIAKCIQGIDISEATASIYLKRILNGESAGHTEFRSPCGAACGQMAVNFDGNVYTCDEGRMLANMGDEIFRLGSVDNTYRELMLSPAAHAVCTASCVEALPICCDCVYSPYCSVCPVVTYGLEGDLLHRNERAYKCVIAKGILTHIFSVIHRNKANEMEILRRWAEN